MESSDAFAISNYLPGVTLCIEMLSHQEAKFFGIIPGARPTDSFGYTQAKKATWDWYQLKTGNKTAKRDDFD